ncbi:MAG: trehalose-phosphatase [Pseudomonadota bacterium]
MSGDLLPPPLLASHALFLDFDGTLAPLQDDPDAVALPDGGAARLKTLSDALGGALAAISGRDVRDLSGRVPLDIWRAGGHGLEICAPAEAPRPKPRPAPGTLTADIEDVVRDFPGTWAEPKGAVVAVHYRAVPDVASALLEALLEVVSPIEGYTVQQGKMVLEAKPSDAHKGRTLEALMARPPFKARPPVMVGDDTTDEDAMASALRLGGFAIKVGPGRSVAPYRLGTPGDVWAWLSQAPH